MTSRELQALVHHWQKRPPFDPGLRGWTITAKFVPAAELDPKRDVYADVRGLIDQKVVTMRVCRPSDMVKFDRSLPIETSICHELLHILQDPNELLANDAIFESSLNAIAEVLSKKK